MTPRHRIAWGVVLALALVAHAVQKWITGVSLQEMAWGCHLATAALALGLLLNLERLAVAGFVFHVGVGLPAYVIEIVTNGTTATSVAAHLLPLFVGAVHLRGRLLPWADGAWGWGLFMVGQGLGVLMTPSLNVNVVYAPYSGTWPDSVALLRVVNAVEGAACLGAALVVLRWVLPRLPTPVVPAGEPPLRVGE